MTQQSTGRIAWIDGLKGISCLLIFTHHFTLEYFSACYYGADHASRLPFEIDTRFSYEPYGVLLNGNFWMCVFLTLSAFLAASNVLRHCGGDWQEKIAGSIIKRYIRLLVPCASGGILYWGLCRYVAPRFACYLLLESPVTFGKLLWHLLVQMWIMPDTEILGPYWMLYLILWGTFIAVILALATRYPQKRVLPFFFLAAATLLWMKDTYYLCAVGGAFSAYLAQRLGTPAGRGVRCLGVLSLTAGLYLGGYPSYAQPVFFYRILGNFADSYMPNKGMPTYHAAAAFLAILGVILCQPAQKALSTRPLQRLGSLSMGVFVLHVVAIQFIGWPLRWLILETQIDYPLAALIIYLIILAVLLLLAQGFRSTVERLLEKVLAWI